MNGVTGRMGGTQHLLRSIMAIRADGGVPLSDGATIWPEPVLVGRNAAKLAALGERHGLPWSTDLDACLGDRAFDVYFDAQLTSLRAPAVKAAIDAGKHIYCEKPLAETTTDALELARAADAAGIKSGIVQDKLFLPGIRKLRRLVGAGFFGRILSVRGEFGYWVHEGDWIASQRPSWNYRAEDGGGIVVDMFPHWQYVLEDLLGPVRRVLCHIATHIPERIDEHGEAYAATADDAAYALFEFDGGVVAQINSSWCVRVHRDELVEFQIDGTQGSAVAGLHQCRCQHRGQTPRPTWNPDESDRSRYRDQWIPVTADEQTGNAFRLQWEDFLRHLVTDAPFPHSFLAGARGVQLAEVALQSAQSRCWADVPGLML
jgi:predicted dehydrogenase